MLSRRVLRIKAMQYLFAFFRQEKAVESLIAENSLKEGDIPRQKRESLQNLKRSLDQELEKINDLFIHFLQLLVDWTRIDKERANALLTPPCSLLAQNHLLQRLQNHAVFSTIAPLSTWPEDLTERWYYQCVKVHPSFLAYTNESSHTHKEDRDLVVDIIKKIIFKHKNIQKYASGKDICWSENKLIVQRLLLNFIEELEKPASSQTTFYRLDISSEVKDFYRRLIGKTVENEAMYEVYIAKGLKNWDLTRITFLDQLLITMALTEVIDFEDIPKNVAINEYVDIAKKYSTPKSHLFINGMLEPLITAIKSKN